MSFNTITHSNLHQKAILMVSFGTSYGDSCKRTIGAVEKAVGEAFPEFEIRRAFTSPTIIAKLKKRDGIEVDTVEEGIGKLLEDGCETLVIQPTYVMKGMEYDRMLKTANSYRGDFKKFAIGAPVLSSEQDFREIVRILSEETMEYARDNTAVVLMGHGTEHEANADYTVLDNYFKNSGYGNYVIGTVEALPSFDEVKEAVKAIGAQKVVLLPFMVVAGDHANHDMAGNENSWKTKFEKEGYGVECVLKGLGEYPGICRLFVTHTQAAMDQLEDKA